jgi:hypothetical protein
MKRTNQCVCQGGWLCPQCRDNIQEENRELQAEVERLKEHEEFVAESVRYETIKRCADIADQSGFAEDTGHVIADAIRKEFGA